ncbi:MAG: hypothetical protein WBX38_13285, partial [Candidatus Sulfotelmatobacter sp.]
MRFLFLRYVFPPALLLLFLANGRGQAPSVSPRNIPTDAPDASIPLPNEPAGANRCKVCHASEVEGYARSAMAHSLRRAADEPAGAVTTSDAKITMYSTPAGSWQRLESGGNVSNYHIAYV